MKTTAQLRVGQALQPATHQEAQEAYSREGAGLVGEGEGTVAVQQHHNVEVPDLRQGPKG